MKKSKKRVFVPINAKVLTDFKVNDEVTCSYNAKYNGHVARVSESYVYIELANGSIDHGWSRDGDIPNEYEPVYADRYARFSIENVNSYGFTIAKRGKSKAGRPAMEKLPKFALQYELDQDPIELFFTLEEAKARIVALIERHGSSFKKDKCYIWTLGKRSKCMISTDIRLSSK